MRAAPASKNRAVHQIWPVQYLPRLCAATRAGSWRLELHIGGRTHRRFPIERGGVNPTRLDAEPIWRTGHRRLNADPEESTVGYVFETTYQYSSGKSTHVLALSASVITQIFSVRALDSFWRVSL